MISYEDIKGGEMRHNFSGLLKVEQTYSSDVHVHHFLG